MYQEIRIQFTVVASRMSEVSLNSKRKERGRNDDRIELSFESTLPLRSKNFVVKISFEFFSNLSTVVNLPQIYHHSSISFIILLLTPSNHFSPEIHLLHKPPITTTQPLPLKVLI